MAARSSERTVTPFLCRKKGSSRCGGAADPRGQNVSYCRQRAPKAAADARCRTRSRACSLRAARRQRAQLERPWPETSADARQGPTPDKGAESPKPQSHARRRARGTGVRRKATAAAAGWGTLLLESAALRERVTLLRDPAPKAAPASSANRCKTFLYGNGTTSASGVTSLTVTWAAWASGVEG